MHQWPSLCPWNRPTPATLPLFILPTYRNCTHNVELAVIGNYSHNEIPDKAPSFSALQLYLAKWCVEFTCRSPKRYLCLVPSIIYIGEGSCGHRDPTLRPHDKYVMGWSMPQFQSTASNTAIFEFIMIHNLRNLFFIIYNFIIIIIKISRFFLILLWKFKCIKYVM